ncbi:hypothetical protein [Kitasatospora sp. NPDC056181]|uniref:hypothetical protein n=1 Tax=Kitasatospora sp. NPDC056181 TaxID=3345737 RepID=UPI0035DA94B7
MTVDLVVNIRLNGANAALAAPLLLAPTVDGVPPALALLGLLPWLSGSYLRLGTTARL